MSNVADYDSISKAPTYKTSEPGEEKKVGASAKLDRPSFAELLAKKLGIQGGVTESEAIQDFMAGFTLADNAQIE